MTHARRLGRRLASCAAALALAAAPLTAGTAIASAASGPTPANLDGSGSFADSFALPAGSVDTAPLYGLNVGLDQRESGTAGQVPYTRVSGLAGVATPPPASYAQTGDAAHPGKLTFSTGTSAVMLGAPVLADAGSYTVSTTVDPVEGDTTSDDSASLVLSRSHRSTGSATNSDVDLGLTVASDGKLALFHAGVPFWTGQVAPGSGTFTVSLKVSTDVDRTVTLTVDGGQPIAVTAPASVTRWPSSSYLYLGASLSSPSEVTSFGDGQGHGLSVSNVDTTASSGVKPFVDTFDGAPNATPDYGLNDDLSARQPTVASSGYTLVSGAADPAAKPDPRAAQVDNPAYPNVLSLGYGQSAVRLDKPVTADLSGTYTVHAVLTPPVGDPTGTGWSSLVVSNSATSDGWVQGADVALGLRVRAGGALMLFQGGTQLWPSEQNVPAAASYSVSIAMADGAPGPATVIVNQSTFTVAPPAALPRDGYVSLGASTAKAGDIATVDDLRLSMAGGLNFFGYFDVSDPGDSPTVNRGQQVQPWTNLNQYFNASGAAGDPASGFLDYCLPASCILSVGDQMGSTTALQQYRAAIGGSIGKVGAIYLQDEPYLHGYTPATLNAAIANVRAVFPDKPLVLNLDVTHLGTGPGSLPIPGGVDLVGFDIYCHGRANLTSTLNLLESQLPSKDQHVFLVPESMTNPEADCTGQQGSDGAAAAAQPDYEAIAATDPRVLYLMGFRWTGTAQATATTPQTLAAQQAMGTAIINSTPIRPASSIGVYQPGTATFHEGDRAGFALGSVLFGNPNWKPLAGDWDGDGKDTIGAYNPTTGTFYLSNDNATPAVTVQFGAAGSVPLSGDWDGDGKDTIGAYNPTTGTFYLSNDNATPAVTARFGNPNWIPLAGDWDGDGKDTIGAYNPTTGTFYLSNDNATPAVTVQFGNPNWIPLAGDWNGDGKDTIGAYDPTTRTFHLSNDNATEATHFTYGNTGDLPFVGAW